MSSFVTEWDKSAQFGGPTPYQGQGRVFGTFLCVQCSNSWRSAGSWANMGQNCRKCHEHIYPHIQVSLLSIAQMSVDAEPLAVYLSMIRRSWWSFVTHAFVLLARHTYAKAQSWWGFGGMKGGSKSGVPRRGLTRTGVTWTTARLASRQRPTASDCVAKD